MRDFHLPGRSAVFASNGMCATSHPLAAKTAIDMLQRGGNAMDAAIAGAVLLGICEPHMTGLGGDCFALFTEPGNNTIHALNGSGRAPACASAQALRNIGHEIVPPLSAHAVTIPGAVDAFCRLSADHGKLGLDVVLQPAIHYAQTGVPVAPRVAFDWPLASASLQGHAIGHFLPNGKPPKAGQIFRAPGQAEVLRRISKDGRDAFYEGEVAEDILQTLQALGGCHKAEDFVTHRSDYTTVISGPYKAMELVEHPPNGQGAIAILMLNILKHFDISRMDPLGPERAHIEAEATKLAYAARNSFIADPDHMDRLDFLLDSKTAEEMAARIDLRHAMPHNSAPSEAQHRDTVYISVVDRDRMAVSLIYSIFHGFGSGIASERFGVLLQNRGAGFTLKEGHPNALAGGKRPMHTIIPGMLREDGRVVMPFGVMGGAFQPTGHVRMVSNLTDFDMDLQSAIDAPRSFADSEGLALERGYARQVARDLEALGHMVRIPREPLGGAQGVFIHKDGVLEGGSDPRKDGCALGY